MVRSWPPTRPSSWRGPRPGRCWPASSRTAASASTPTASGPGPTGGWCRWWSWPPPAGDALELLIRRRRADGRWQPGGYWWRPPGTGTGSGPVEVVDWGRSGPNEMLTLNALRVLKAAG
jgi:hypothetical protein